MRFEMAAVQSNLYCFLVFAKSKTDSQTWILMKHSSKLLKNILY